jgi:Escherichia/Staphylococcus phage prohead protease
MSNISYRHLALAELRTSPSSRTICGYAAVFNQLSQNLGGFREQIAKGTFARALSEGQDVRCLVDHTASKILGRTKAGTLTLREDSHGLEFTVSVPDTSLGNDTLTSVARGDISQCSFGFRCVSDSWSADRTLRTLEDVDLLDVSLVTYPAYPQTSVSVRNDNGEIESRWYLGADEPLIVEPTAEQVEKLRLRLRLARAIK